MVAEAAGGLASVVVPVAAAIMDEVTAGVGLASGAVLGVLVSEEEGTVVVSAEVVTGAVGASVLRSAQGEGAGAAGVVSVVPRGVVSS